jgi:predicted ribosome quality control (RQC) complex YloA/Tae2 family protein
VLVRRLGHELEQRLRGARVFDAGLLPDGRLGIALRAGGARRLLAVDPFTSPPLVTLEDAELGVAVEPGFVRTLRKVLNTMTLASVRARLGDRLLRLTFASRSRFGVGDSVELYLELVPRFGNLVLVKHERVVAAAKEFSLAENSRRAVAAGLAYVPPPLPPGSPLVPKLVAQGDVDAEAFLAFAQSDAVLHDPLYVYRRDGVVLQAHVVALAPYADAQVTREGSLLDLLIEVRNQERGRGERERDTRRRQAVLKRLRERARKLQDELLALDAKRSRANERDALRTQGEHIFATLHELSATAREEAKERAGELFAAYKKLGALRPHLDRRERAVRAALEGIETLQWEAERIACDDLTDLEATVAQVDGRARTAGQRGRAVPQRKRTLLEFRTPGGSRIVVGRSPGENAEVTFKIARPGDLWFHAQAIPGAHVILARDDRAEPPAADIEAAASLAAHYSKARASAKVPVDYTQRKYVRKRRDAPPGLVWYTNARTVTTAPRERV